MKKRRIDAHAIIQELIKRLGGNHSIKLGITDDNQQRIVVRNWVTGEEKLNVPIFDKVLDPFDLEEVRQKIVQTFLNF